MDYYLFDIENERKIYTSDEIRYLFKGDTIIYSEEYYIVQNRYFDLDEASLYLTIELQ